MRPSIMSLGATMSTPASACTSACCDQHRDRLVVDDVAAVVEQAVLAVRGERVERDVGQQPELGEALLQLAQRPRHQALGVERLAAVVASSARGRSPGTAPSPGCRASRHCSATGSRRSSAAPLHAGHRRDVFASCPGRRARTPAGSGRSAVRRCSRTSARLKASRRSRRGRLAGRGSGGTARRGDRSGVRPVHEAAASHLC